MQNMQTVVAQQFHTYTDLHVLPVIYQANGQGIANQFNTVADHFNSLSDRVSTLSNDLQAFKKTSRANYTALSQVVNQEQNKRQEAIQTHDKEFQARDITINAQANEIKNLQQREVNANSKISTLEAQIQEERVKAGLNDNRIQKLEGQIQGINQAQAGVVEAKIKVALIEQQNKIQFKTLEEERNEQEILKKGVLSLAKTVQNFQRTLEKDKHEAKVKGDKDAFTIAQLRAQIAGGMAPVQANIPEVQVQVEEDPVIAEIEKEMAAEEEFRHIANNLCYHWTNGIEILNQPFDPVTKQCYYPPDREGWTIFHAAVYFGAVETLKELIACLKGTPGQIQFSGKGALPFYAQRWEGGTPEHRYLEARLMVGMAFGGGTGNELQTLSEQSAAIARLQEIYKVSRGRLCRYLEALNEKMKDLSLSYDAFRKRIKKKEAENTEQIAQLSEEITKMKAKKSQEGIKKLSKQKSLVNIKS